MCARARICICVVFLIRNTPIFSLIIIIVILVNVYARLYISFYNIIAYNS
jgi:hypothetical protein